MLTRSSLVKGSLPLPSTLQHRKETPLPSSSPRPEWRTDPAPPFVAWETQPPPGPATEPVPAVTATQPLRAIATQPLPASLHAAITTPAIPGAARVPGALSTPFVPRPAPCSSAPLIKRHAVSTPPPGFDPSKVFTPTVPAPPFIPASPLVTPTAPALAHPGMPPRPLFAPPRETIRSVEIPVEGPIVDAYAPSPDTPSTVPPVAFSVVPTPIPGSYRPSLPEVDPILLAKMGADVALRRAIFTRVVKGAVAACGAVCLIAVVCLAAGGDDGPTSAAPPKVKPRSLVTERESLVVASNAKLLARKSDKPERSTPKVVAKQATSRGSEATTQRGPTRAPGPRRK